MIAGSFRISAVPGILKEVLSNGSLGAKGVKVKIEHRLALSGSYTLKVNGNITIDATGIVKINGSKVLMNN